MKKVNFEQGSEEWLNWRKGLLTATDAPMLLGASPYVTPYKGWQRKVGQAAEQKVNSAMMRGTRDEPIAREMFINQSKINMTPCCIESEKYNFLGASLDGISDCGKYILEIKSQYPDYLNESGIPIFHMMQMQHQLLCTDGTAEMCYYVSYWDGEIIVMEVLPDPNWVENYIPKAKSFWKSIIFFEPPPMGTKDYKDMSHDASWRIFSQEYLYLCERIKGLEETKEEYRKKLIELCRDENCYGHGIKILKKITKGRIDYESIPELSSINLENYRKPCSSSFTLMIDK